MRTSNKTLIHDPSPTGEGSRGLKAVSAKLKAVSEKTTAASER
ncbi:MAG: hypothetical protein V4580_03835 [Bacteroidota bacterium]